MASSSSLSATLSLLPLCNTSTSLKPKDSFSFSLQPSKPSTSLRSHAPSFVVTAALEALHSSPDTLDGSESSTGFEVEDKSEGSGTSPLAAGDDVKLFSGGGSPLLLRRPFTQLHSSPHEISSVSQEKLIIRNTSGENLVGILHEAGSAELVILCHGFRSSKESKTILNLVDALTVENISVFCFDFSGNGDSEGSFQYGNYWREVEDLRAVVLHFLRQKRGTRAIVGHSKGGNVVLLYASKYHDISKIVNISGRFYMERGIEERLGEDFMHRIKEEGFIDVRDKMGRIIYRVTAKGLMDRLGTDMRDACLSIDQNCRVLTIHGSKDEIVPSEDAREFAKLITNHKLHIIEGADHRYLSRELQLANVLLEFIRSN